MAPVAGESRPPRDDVEGSRETDTPFKIDTYTRTPYTPLNHMSDPRKKRAQKRFYQKHRERRIALSKAWKQENRKLYNRYMRNYRAKSKAQPSAPSRDPADY